MTTHDAWNLRVFVLLTGIVTNGTARVGEEPRPARPSVQVAVPTNEAGIEGKVWRILCASVTQGKATPAAAKKNIAALGTEAVPVLLRILTGSITEPELPADFVVHPELIAHRQAILQDSLRAFPAAIVLTAVRALATPDTDIDLRLLLIQIAGRTGNANALDVVLELASALEPIHFERAYVQSAIEGALTDVLQGDPSTFQRLPQTLARTARPLLPLAVSAIGKAGSSAGVPVLAGMFGKDEVLDLLVVEQLGQVAEESYADLPSVEIARLQRFLESADVQIARAAAKALGRVGDASSCPHLIALLDHSDKRVVTAAHWSLKQISRLDIGANVKDWSRWYQGQEQWHDTEFDVLMQRLHSDNAGEVVHALGKLVVHPLFKHEAARELCSTLDANQPALARTACSTLGQLGSTRAVPFLVALLDASDDALRLQAAETLRVLTGRKLPPERAVWCKELRL